MTGAVSLWGVLGEGCHWTDLSKSFPMVVQTLRKGQMVMRNEGVKVGREVVTVGRRAARGGDAASPQPAPKMI